MADPHARFEEYALAHVLGGLPREEAALFRTHLADCRDCRMRVAELRDLAADLASAEREERRRASVATRVAQASDDEDGGDERRWFAAPPWWAQAVAAAVLVAVLGILFWNYHLRRVTNEYAEAVASQSAVLAVLADGEPVEVDGDRGVRGIAAVDDRTLAADLAGLPQPEEGQVLVAWFLDRAGEVVDRYPLSPGEDGALPFTSEVGGATTLVVTLEEMPPGEAPGDLRLAQMDLPSSP